MVQDSECREIMFKGRKRLYGFSLNVPQGLTLIIRRYVDSGAVTIKNVEFFIIKRQACDTTDLQLSVWVDTSSDHLVKAAINISELL